jgi:hypothetical protein
MHDPFRTAELRARVLDAWRASPARFRADANVEDDLALTGYRERVVVELAQNAADAATRAGIAGRLTLSLDENVLTATNIGTPLDAAGVESIAVARASAKVGELETVGRFGVGFTAVLAVSDEPRIESRTGAVRWSRRLAQAAAAKLPHLAEELAARGTAVPVLRLPFPYEAPAPADADTAVVLPLRDETAVESVRSQLLGLDPTILFALPALAEIIVRVDGVERIIGLETTHEVALLRDGATTTRWHVTTDEGSIVAELLAGRPAEEQRFDSWQVTWAIPVDETNHVVALPESVAGVVRAPTAVDDPLTTPAVMIASYPLDSTRRRVTPGALADEITDRAADVLLDAITTLPTHPSLLRLVPAGFPNGEIDGALHAAIRERLASTAWLPIASDPERRQPPREALLVDDALVGVLAEVTPGVLPAGWGQPALIALEVRRPRLVDLVEQLSSIPQEPGWWRRLYDGLDAALPPGPERDALGALPVPLADGSMAIGPRGLVLLDPGIELGDLSALRVRLVHPGAAHPLLRTLGAIDGTPRALLEQSRSAVETSYDDSEPEPIASAVLSLVAAAGVGADELPWLVELALTDDAGDWRPAGELLLPDGLMATVIAEDSALGILGSEWLDRADRSALAAVGVVDRPALVRESDVVSPDHDLDDEEKWWSILPPNPAVEELVAVRDLEQVRDDAVQVLLPTLAEPPLRAAIVEPALVTTIEGRRRVVPYTAWWLSSRPVLDGRVPRDLQLGSGDSRLVGLYDEVSSTLDEEFLRAIGVLGSLDDAHPDDVLDRLADPARTVGRTQLRALYRWLAGRRPTPPGRLRAMLGGEIVVVPAGEVVIIDAPDLVPLIGNRAYLPVTIEASEDLARQLNVRLASEIADYAVVSSGIKLDDAWVHDELLVRDAAGAERHVTWRYFNGVLHVDRNHLAVGLGRGRAWRDGDWAQRHRRTEALIDPLQGRMRADEDDFDAEMGEW